MDDVEFPYRWPWNMPDSLVRWQPPQTAGTSLELS